MPGLPTIENAEFSDKKVILRADLDVKVEEGKILESWRLDLVLPTISSILDKGASQILIVGHMGRPDGKPDEKLSLKPLVNFFSEKVTPEIEFIEYQEFSQYFQVQEKILASTKRLVLLENLRFWPQEEANDEQFATQLAYGMDVFVNDAFGSSHRAHASIVGLPKQISPYLGLQFEKEIENLGKVFDNPKHPVIALISGAKKDKTQYFEKFKSFCDKILVSGRLPEYMPEDNLDPKLLVAKLNPDKEDITIHSIENFEIEVAKAGTIILAGPIGLYEDLGHRLGTQRVFEAVAKSDALKIAGGGDTISAINTLNLSKNFDWISAGGGAMLDFLANKTLPGIDAIANK